MKHISTRNDTFLFPSASYFPFFKQQKYNTIQFALRFWPRNWKFIFPLFPEFPNRFSTLQTIYITGNFLRWTSPRWNINVGPEVGALYVHCEEAGTINYGYILIYEITDVKHVCIPFEWHPWTSINGLGPYSMQWLLPLLKIIVGACSSLKSESGVRSCTE